MSLPNEYQGPQTDSAEPDTLRIVVSHHRAAFEPNDFRDLEQCECDDRICSYVDEQLSWFWWTVPKKIVIELNEPERNLASETTTRQAYRQLFHYRAAQIWARALRLLARMLLLASVGVVALFVSNIVTADSDKESWIYTIGEIIRVAGWVSTWTAIVGFVYGCGVHFTSSVNFTRVSRLPVEFSYKGNEEPIQRHRLGRFRT